MGRGALPASVMSCFVVPFVGRDALHPSTFLARLGIKSVKNRCSRGAHRAVVFCIANLRTFQPSDFEIRRIVGQQSFATITDWEYYIPAPLSPTRTTEPSAPAIRLYEARIAASIPSLYNARVLLKEFLPPGIDLGVSEIEAYNSIYSSETNIDPNTIPVATLLGSFITDDSFARPSFKASWSQRFPRSPEAPLPEAPFLVFRWEGIQSALSVAASTERKTGEDWFDNLFPSNLRRRKALYIRKFMRESLKALAFLHTKTGIVHRSVGLASIMVNSNEWRYASSLQVKLRDFGFAKPVSALAEGPDLERARRAEAFSPSEIVAFHFSEDVYALGYAFLEFIFSVFGTSPITQDTFKKLFEDTFSFKREAIQQYCREDPNWVDAVAFLDERNGEGWDLVLSMLQARENYKIVSLDNLLQSSFLEDE